MWVIHDIYSRIPRYFHGVDPKRTDYQFTRWAPWKEGAITFGTYEAADYISRKVGGYPEEQL